MGLFGPSKLTKSMNATMDRIQAQQLAPETTAAFEQSKMLANTGLSGAAKTMATNALNRNQMQMISALRGKKAALQSIGAIDAMGQDSALNLAGMENEALRRNQEQSMQMGMNIGQQKQELQKYKLEALWNRDMATKERRAGLTSSIISAVGQIAGSAAGKK